MAFPVYFPASDWRHGNWDDIQCTNWEKGRGRIQPPIWIPFGATHVKLHKWRLLLAITVRFPHCRVSPNNLRIGHRQTAHQSNSTRISYSLLSLRSGISLLCLIERQIIPAHPRNWFGGLKPPSGPETAPNNRFSSPRYWRTKTALGFVSPQFPSELFPERRNPSNQFGSREWQCPRSIFSLFSKGVEFDGRMSDPPDENCCDHSQFIIESVSLLSHADQTSIYSTIPTPRMIVKEIQSKAG
jgi:hypothetical protein